MIRVIRCHPNRFDALVDFVAAYNPLPEHHIGYFGLTPADIRQELRHFSLRFDRATSIAVEGGRIVGAFGADVDAEIGRAWLFGPLVAAQGAAERAAEPWATTADALYAAVAARLPAAVREHQMFVDSRNVRAAAFAGRHGFAPAGEWAIYFLPAGRLDALPAAEAQPWDARYNDQLDALHNRLFPSSNYTLGYILREWAERGAILLVAAEGDTLHGYFFGRVEAETGEATVDLVGVDETRRRAGLGRRLMLAGLARMRGAPGLRQVNLSVAAANTPARTLYEDLGFLWERDMAAYQRALTSASLPSNISRRMHDDR